MIASNRGPIVYGRSDGQRTARRGGGGLVTALSGLVASQDVTWVAAAISAEDEEVAAEHDGAVEETDRDGNAFRLRLVRLDRADYDRYYNVFANPLLWFIQHGLWNRPYTPEMSAATRAAWEAYRRVNEAFAEAIADGVRRRRRGARPRLPAVPRAADAAGGGHAARRCRTSRTSPGRARTPGAC